MNDYFCIYNKTQKTYYSGGSYGGRFGQVIKLYSRERDADAAVSGFAWDMKILGYACHHGVEKGDVLEIRRAKIVVDVVEA